MSRPHYGYIDGENRYGWAYALVNSGPDDVFWSTFAYCSPAP